MEGYAHLCGSQESEWDSFGSTMISLPRNIDVETDSGGGDNAVFGDRREMAIGSTSCNFKIPNLDDRFEDFYRSAASPEPTHRRTPGAAVTGTKRPQAAAAATVRPQIAPHSLFVAAHRQTAEARLLASTTRHQTAAAGPLASMTRHQASTICPQAESAGSEPASVSERALAAWTAIANKHRGLEHCDGQDGNTWPNRDLPAKTAHQIMWELLQDPTFDGTYLVQLLLEKVRSKFGPPSLDGPSGGGDQPCCKFCRNNNEEDIYHQFKDASGLVLCPVLSKHVCDLCGVSGPYAHTRKYCPKNPLTMGCPEEGGFPPGMLPKDVYETTQVMLNMINFKKKL